jgi:exodeoxyribonuclease VII small subunit
LAVQSQPAAEPTFEQALASLEQIVRELEEGRCGLAESLARYEEGVKLLKQCHLQLQQAERRIEVLTGVDAAGNPVTQPFDDESTLARQAEGKPRSRRAKAASGAASESVVQNEVDTFGPAIDEPGTLF